MRIGNTKVLRLSFLQQEEGGGPLQHRAAIEGHGPGITGARQRYFVARFAVQGQRRQLHRRGMVQGQLHAGHATLYLHGYFPQ